jgi:crotonobetainyl-CoA:carnitine CoA-transferase CaiB-like acyl-CoA transferase
MTNKTLPLEGVRVLELARILAGPWAGQLLSDLGAEVIKVERPEYGDDTRSWGPPFVPSRKGGHLGAAYFHAANRGKKSVVANFDQPSDQDLLRELAVSADVVIENFKVGGLERYGLDANTLRKLKPSLIVCSITGYGQEGPYSAQAGYDFAIQGLGGMMSITGDADGSPTKVGVAVADVFSGVYAATAILAALRKRDATGEGAWIDISLLDTQVSVLANQALNYLVSGRSPTRLGNAHPNIVPYQVFEVADGHVVIAVGNDEQFMRLTQVLGYPDLGADPRYQTNELRVLHRDELISVIASIMKTQKRDALLEALAKRHVPCGPINDIATVFADPHVQHRGLRIDLPHDESLLGTVPGVRSPIVIDGVPMASSKPAPMLGQHGHISPQHLLWK